jgi:hypothetical protein
MKSKRIKKPKVTEADIAKAKLRAYRTKQQRQKRKERAANGLCMYCHEKQMPDSNYCRKHIYEIRKLNDRSGSRKHIRVGRVRRIWADAELFFKDKTLCDLYAITSIDVMKAIRCGQPTACRFLNEHRKKLSK